MEKDAFLAFLAEILETPLDELTPATELAALPLWDSTAVIGFLDWVDEHRGKLVRADRVLACRTVGDLTTLAGEDDPPAAD